jgi:hypothetical protein
MGDLTGWSFARSIGSGRNLSRRKGSPEGLVSVEKLGVDGGFGGEGLWSGREHG